MELQIGIIEQTDDKYGQHASHSTTVSVTSMIIVGSLSEFINEKWKIAKGKDLFAKIDRGMI